MRTYKDELLYSFHLIFHPFDGFWDLKHEKRGSIRAAITIVMLTVAVFILQRQLTGFIFNYNDPLKFNLAQEVFSVVIPYLLWCISNWCLTTLMDGEGSFKDILIATAYSLVPLVIINAPLILLSRVITIQEGTFYYMLMGFAMLWAGGLLFAGMLVTHQYGIFKNFLTCIFTIVGIALIVFLFILFFYLLQQMYGFIFNIYREISFRH